MTMPCPITGEPVCRCRASVARSTWTNPKETLRKLWTDHAVYTKFAITDLIESLDNTECDLKRLLQNQDEIGDFVSTALGADVGVALTALLRTHIHCAASCVMALINHDPYALQAHKEALFQNARQVAALLFSAQDEGVGWTLDKWEDMFTEHNQLVLDLAIAQFHHDSDLVVSIFDSYYTHMLCFSDAIHDIGSF